MLKTPSEVPSTDDEIIDHVRNERNRSVFLRHIFVIRLINAWWIATFFQPDEYFQSLEPAWRLAFGPDSGAWLTWVSKLGVLLYIYIHTFYTILDMHIYMCFLL